VKERRKGGREENKGEKEQKINKKGGGDKNRGAKGMKESNKADERNNEIWKEEKKIEAATHFNYFFFHDK